MRLSLVLAVWAGWVARTGATEMGARGSAQAIMEQPGFQEGLLWLGADEPPVQQSDRLWEVVRHLDQPSWTGEAERFLGEYPASPWAASVHHAYASFCRRTGRTSKALAHWERAWGLVKEDTSRSGRLLGGTILAHWSELLWSLGQVEKLEELVSAAEGWGFVSQRDRERFLRARAGCGLMRSHPGMAGRCGTLTLRAVGQALQPANGAWAGLTEGSAPRGGFSLAALEELAGRQGLDLVAARRKEGAELIVPSVVHWRQNHYGAILEQRGDACLVSDPVLGRPQWLSVEAINEEASGSFLVPAGRLGRGWARLERREAEAVRGLARAYGDSIDDGKDRGKRDSCQTETGGDAGVVGKRALHQCLD